MSCNVLMSRLECKTVIVSHYRIDAHEFLVYRNTGQSGWASSLFDVIWYMSAFARQLPYT